MTITNNHDGTQVAQARLKLVAEFWASRLLSSTRREVDRKSDGKISATSSEKVGPEISEAGTEATGGRVVR